MTDDQLHAKWFPVARSLYRNAHAPVERLARQLGVAKCSLDTLYVGYGEVSGRMCWSFPEQNARGQIVGINRRLVTPVDDKHWRGAPNAQRGLTYADDWAAYSGPVFIVEGGSDTAAGLTMGLCVIGRPSNLGGIDHLVEMLGPVDRKRPIVVVGELDRKRHEDLKPLVQQRHDPNCPGCIACWPGLFGAKMTALTLQKRLSRRVKDRLPPDEAKDMRAWLNAQAVDVEVFAAPRVAGKRFIRAMGELT